MHDPGYIDEIYDGYNKDDNGIYVYGNKADGICVDRHNVIHGSLLFLILL